MTHFNKILNACKRMENLVVYPGSPKQEFWKGEVEQRSNKNANVRILVRVSRKYQILTTQLNNLASLAKGLSVCL